MISAVFGIVLLIAAFIGGIFVGANSSVTVEKAIDTIKEAESQAKATVEQIIAHKAS